MEKDSSHTHKAVDRNDYIQKGKVAEVLSVWEDAQRWVSSASYGEAWEGSAILGELYAYGAFFITACQKMQMASRVAAGETPFRDSWMIEYAGRLIPVGSGICYPFAQMSLAAVLAAALAALIWEWWNETHLLLANVNVETQRRRRVWAVIVLLGCTVISSMPPQPEPIGTLF